VNPPATPSFTSPSAYHGRLPSIDPRLDSETPHPVSHEVGPAQGPDGDAQAAAVIVENLASQMKLSPELRQELHGYNKGFVHLCSYPKGSHPNR
jgi:hypothetical protein